MPAQRPTILDESLSAADEPSCVPRLPGPIYAVASPANGSGKTSLACALVRSLPGATAIKFTTVRKDGSRCPRSTRICACRNLSGAYVIIEDPEVIQQPGTDTGRLFAAGAKQVIWCLARPRAYPSLLHALSKRLDTGPLIIEGNTALNYIQNAMIIFVFANNENRNYKASTKELLLRASIIFLNIKTDLEFRGVDLTSCYIDRQSSLGASPYIKVNAANLANDAPNTQLIHIIRRLGSKVS
jgi:molybdopterin-guanine dinucleotide biosynthesis protein